MEKTELIEENATFCDLIDLLRHSPKTSAKEIIDNISPELIDRTIDKTINEDQPISTIGPGLRALKTKGLLDKLEEKVGAANYLKLVEEKGTFLELVYILQYSSQAIAKEVIKILSKDLTTKLVDKIIEEKRPINSIRRELNLLKRLCGGFDREFEQKVGVDNVLRLIFNNGNLGVITDLIVYFTNNEISQLKLIEAFNAFPGDRKDEFILRGDFYKLCSAMVQGWQLNIFSENSREFSASEVLVVKTLIDKSTFKSINRGLGFLDHYPNQGLKRIFFKLAADYIDKIKIESIQTASISEGISYLSILNRLGRIDKNSIEEIVGNIDEQEFLEETDFIGSLQLLQHILVTHDFASGKREEILALANSDKVIRKLGKETPLNAFLYLWNTYALFIQENPEGFENWLNLEIVDTIYCVIEKQKKGRTNIEGTRHLLMLLGLLDYLGIQRERIRRIFPRGFRLLNLSKTFLAQVLQRSTFIPGFFYLKGIDLFVKKPLFPNKWKILIPRAFELNLKTKGVRKLLEVFQKKIRKKIFPL